MSIIKLATNKMTKVLDAIPTLAGKNAFRKQIWDGVAKTQEFQPTTLMHSLINRRAGQVAQPMVRSSAQMAAGIQGNTLRTFSESPVSFKMSMLNARNTIHSGIGYHPQIGFMARIPKYTGDVEHALVGSHEGHELGSVLANSKTKDIAGMMEEGSKNNQYSHHNFSVVGRDSNLLSRNFHPLQVTDSYLRNVDGEAQHFKHITGKEFGTKLNRKEIQSLGEKYTDANAARFSSEAYPNAFAANEELDKRKSQILMNRSIAENVLSKLRKGRKVPYTNFDVKVGGRLEELKKSIESRQKTKSISGFEPVLRMHNDLNELDQKSKELLGTTLSNLTKKRTKSRPFTQREGLLVNRLTPSYSGNIEIRRSLANHFGVKKPSYLSPDKKVPFAKVMRKKVGESTTQAPALTERFKDFSEYRKLNKDKFTGDNFSKVKALREKHDFEYM